MIRMYFNQKFIVVLLVERGIYDLDRSVLLTEIISSNTIIHPRTVVIHS